MSIGAMPQVCALQYTDSSLCSQLVNIHKIKLVLSIARRERESRENALFKSSELVLMVLAIQWKH